MLADYQRVIETLKQCETSGVTSTENYLMSLAMGDVEVLGCLRQCLTDLTISSKWLYDIGSIHSMATASINMLFTSNIAEYPQ
jgi:hypothetical protein